MQKFNFDPTLSILEHDAEIAWRRKEIEQIHVIETVVEGEIKFYCTIKLAARDFDLYICSQRNRKEAKTFKILDRLHARLIELFPGITHYTCFFLPERPETSN